MRGRVPPASRLAAGLLCLAALWLTAARPAQAVEGGASHYTQGSYGDFLMGLIPGPGFSLRNDAVYQSGHLDGAVKGGRLYAGLDLTSVVNITELTYFFDVPAVGGYLGLGLGLPVIVNEHVAGDVAADYARRSRTTGLDTLRHISFGGGGDRGGLSDLFFMPLMAGWNFGPCHLAVTPIVFLPTGSYDKTKLTNLGLNYATFDGNLAFTWLGKNGFEFSLNAGYMTNTENPATKYVSGNQLHVDWTAAYHCNPRLALGAVGYLLAQTTPDAGPGATMGSFYSSGTGLGPAVTYTVPVADQDVMLIAKWLHGLGASHSFLGDTVYASFALAF